MGKRLCRSVVAIMTLLYLVALGLFVIGALGWFGQEPTPLAGVFLVPLGLPWNLWLDPLPEALRPWAAGLTPLLNISVVAVLCRVLRRSSQR
jgi:hypothetical protein